MIPLMPEIREQLLMHGIDAGIGDEIAMSEHHIQRIAQILKDQLP